MALIPGVEPLLQRQEVEEEGIAEAGSLDVAGCPPLVRKFPVRQRVVDDRQVRGQRHHDTPTWNSRRLLVHELPDHDVVRLVARAATHRIVQARPLRIPGADRAGQVGDLVRVLGMDGHQLIAVGVPSVAQPPMLTAVRFGRVAHHVERVLHPELQSAGVPRDGLHLRLAHLVELRLAVVAHQWLLLDRVDFARITIPRRDHPPFAVEDPLLCDVLAHAFEVVVVVERLGEPVRDDRLLLRPVVHVPRLSLGLRLLRGNHVQHMRRQVAVIVRLHGADLAIGARRTDAAPHVPPGVRRGVGSAPDGQHAGLCHVAVVVVDLVPEDRQHVIEGERREVLLLIDVVPSH